MARGLTKKQRGFVKDYLKTGNGTQAAMNHYDITDRRVAQVMASENLTKPMVLSAIHKALPDELLAKVHLEGLHATQLRFTPEGVQLEVEDFATRHKYLDSAYKLRGDFAPEKHVNVELTPLLVKFLDAKDNGNTQ